MPTELLVQIVSLKVYSLHFDFVTHDAEVTSHIRSFERKQTRYDWQLYLSLVA